jgi:LmbE family N-acetylglucosaminyl deacetylase
VTAGSDIPTPRRALAVGAHPDDIEFGCAGTLAKWADDGARIDLLVLTDGSKGTWDPAADPAELVATRRREQDDAAARLGARAHWLGLVDGELMPGDDARRRVVETIRALRPDVVLTHDPWRRHRLHPDHHAAGVLVVEALVAARDPHFYPGVGEPHRPDHLLLFEADSVDHVESIGDRVATKIEALFCHRSQWRSTMGIDDDVPVQSARFARRIEVDAKADGARIGVAHGEAFKRMRV